MNSVSEGVAVPNVAVLIRITTFFSLRGEDLLATDDKGDVKIGDGCDPFEGFTQSGSILTIGEVAVRFVLEFLKGVERILPLKTMRGG